MALNDLTRISTAGIATGSTIDSPILRKDVSLRGSQVGVTSALFDSSENELNFKDNVELSFGDKSGGDLKLYHDGNHNRITSTNGFLAIANTADLVSIDAANRIDISDNFIRLRSRDGSDVYMTGTVNSSVDLYHNGGLRFSTTGVGASCVGIMSATTFSGPISNPSGISTFYDLRVSNNLTVEGSTTTLDTNLIGVDRVEVGANSNTVAGIAVTQSGTADIVRLYDGASQVLTVDDEGNVGVGINSPTTKLQVHGGLVKISGHAYARVTVNDGANEAFFGFENQGPLLIGNANADAQIRVQGTNDIFFQTGNTVKRLTIKGDTGNVGIGSEIPSAKLDVFGQTNLDNVSIAGISTFTGRIDASDNIAITSGNRLYFGNSDVAFVKGVHGGSGYLALGANNEHVRITRDGKVGIGTVTPGRELTIYSPDSGSTYLNLTNATTGAGSNSGFALGLGGDEVGRIWQYGASQMEFGTNSTQHMTLASTGQLGIGTDFDPAATSKKLTLILDSVGDGIWIANKENLYSAASTGYSDLRFTFRDYLTGGYTSGGEAIIRGYSENAYATQRRAALIFMTSSSATSGNATGDATEKMRLSSYGQLSFAGDTDTYIHHPEDNELAITVSGGSQPIARFGTGGNNATVGINTDGNLVTNSEILSVRGYTSMKSVNHLYAALYTHNESQGGGNICAHILFNVGGANRGGFGYGTDNSTLIMGNQNAISFRTGATNLNGTERLHITNVGDVGISSDAPRAKLDVKDQGTSKDVILRVSADNNTPYGLVVGNDTFNTTSNRGLAMWVGGSKTHHIQARTSTTQSENTLEIEAYKTTIQTGTSVNNDFLFNSDGSLRIGAQAATGAVSGGRALMISASDGARVKLCRDSSGVTASDGFEIVMANDDKAYIWNRESADMLFGTGGNERLKIQSNGRINIGEGNSGSPLAAVHINTNAVMGTDTALWVGSNSDKRYMAIQQNSSTEQFSHMDLYYNDNGSRSMINLQNPYAPAGYGSAITWKGYNGGTQGYIECKSEGANSATGTMYLNTTNGTFLQGNSNRHVKMPQQPSFAVYRNQSSWNVNNGDRMEFNTARHNTGGHFDVSGSYPGRFTAPIAGSYQFNFYSILRGNYTNAYIQLYVSGSRIYGGDIHFTISNNSSSWHNVSYSQVLYLSSDDYVELFSYTGTGSGSVDWHGNHWQCFSGWLLG